MPPRKINGHWHTDFWIQPPGKKRERVRKKSPINTKKAAAEYEEALKEAALSTSKRSAPAPTLEQFTPEFITYAANNNQFSEVESKESILRVHLLPAFGPLPLDQITARGIEAYKASKRAGEPPLSNKTINNHLAVLNKILNVAKEWKLIPEAPSITWCRVAPQRFDFFTFEEASRLIEGAAPGLARTIILVGLRTGLRIGELLALRHGDIVGRKILVSAAIVRERYKTPKSNRQREVPLSEEAFAALEAWRAQTKDHRYIFSTDAAKPLTRGNVLWMLNRACKAADLRKVGPHVLRHTFASHLAMHGVPIKAIQELMGHSTIEMTMRYAHLAPAMKESAVALLDGQSKASGKAAIGQRSKGTKKKPK